MIDPATGVAPQENTEVHPSVDELAEEYARRLRDGEKPTVEEYVEKYPQWEGDIRDVFSAVALMEELKPRSEDVPAPVKVKIERLGEYRIVRELGRGGMGIVYEAEQEALARRVAIKVLPAHLLTNEKLRQRFRREAQAAAKLHHTNIVPVFGVGEQEGLCYYVMQLIVGRGLDRVLKESPNAAWAWAKTTVDKSRDNGELFEESEAGTIAQGLGDTAQPDDALLSQANALTEDYVRCVARIGVQVSDALAYAHAQGILHRDIKPSNLLLDRQGTVWITDFGVAKLIEEGNLTQPGDLVGTLRYMPPERFHGESNARGDVYSLGITLFELLAGKSAFPETNPQHLIKLITHEELPRLRKVNPRVPRDLETIVAKAIARDQEHRYVTAHDMAEDLRRFLDERPILARRTSSLEQLWRWGKRNKLVASLAALTMLSLVLVAVVSVTAYMRAKSDREEVESAKIKVDDALADVKKSLASEKRQRELMEATAGLSLDALNKIYDRFAPHRIVVIPEAPVEGADGDAVEAPIQPVLSRESAPLLEELLVFYERLAEQGSDYAALRGQAAEANHRIGDLRQRMGQLEKALTAYERAIDLYQQAKPEAPENASVGVKLARSFNELGRVYRMLQDRDDEAKAHAQALETLTKASPELARKAVYRYELARTHYFMAQREPEQGGPGRTRPTGPPRPPGTGRPMGPRPPQPIDQAIKLLEVLADEDENVPEYRHLLACCYRDVPPERFGRGPQGTSNQDKAIEILKKLVEKFPHAPDFRYDLAETYAKVEMNRLTFPFRPGGTTNAEPRLQQALTILKDLVTDFPTVFHYASSYAQVHYKLGLLQQRGRKLNEAEQSLRKAVTLQTALVTRYPKAPANLSWLEIMQSTLSRLLIERGQWKEALAMLDGIYDRQSKLPEAEKAPWYVRNSLASGYRSLGDALVKAGEKEKAEEAKRRVEKLDVARPTGPQGFRDRRRP